jgi:hypothetical protein
MHRSITTSITPVSYYTKNVWYYVQEYIHVKFSTNPTQVKWYLHILTFILKILTFYDINSAVFPSVTILSCVFTSWTFTWICVLMMIPWRWHLCRNIPRDLYSFNIHCYTFVHWLVFIGLVKERSLSCRVISVRGVSTEFYISLLSPVIPPTHALIPTSKAANRPLKSASDKMTVVEKALEYQETAGP